MKCCTAVVYLYMINLKVYWWHHNYTSSDGNICKEFVEYLIWKYGYLKYAIGYISVENWAFIDIIKVCYFICWQFCSTDKKSSCMSAWISAFIHWHKTAKVLYYTAYFSIFIHQVNCYKLMYTGRIVWWEYFQRKLYNISVGF